MADSKDPEAPHEERVQRAFDAFHEELAEKLTVEHRESLERMRSAAAAKDADSVRAQLDAVKESDSWLYREMTAHPDFAALINELALLGF